jgi:hypothetical protein
VALITGDLDAVEREIESGLGLSMCFRDPGVGEFGLRNALYPIGEQLLEVLTPTTDDTTAGRLLERRGGDTGYMEIVQTDEPVRETCDRMGDLDVRSVYTATAPGITGLHLHPRDVGGSILSIDHAAEWPEWPWAGPNWRDHIRTTRVAAIRSVDVAADDPVAMCARWADVLDRPVDAGATVIELDDESSIGFVPAAARGEGLDAIELAAARRTPANDTDIAGCRARVR